MTRSGSPLFALFALGTLAAVLSGGCARRPASTQATAPAPGRPSAEAPSGAAQAAGRAAAGPGRSAPGTTPRPSASTPRPAAAEFRSMADLKDVFFDFDRYEIRPGDARVLEANAAWLRANANYLVLVEGHCDERGTNEYNVALGERRAKSAMNYLVSQGVEASRFTVVSYGEERPACTEQNESCWGRNRRAHFLVKPR